MVVVVAGEQRENEATPQFAKVAGNIIAELTDAIRQHGVSTKVALGQSQQAGRGDEWDADFSRTIKAGDDGDALAAHWHEPMFRDLDAGLLRQREGKNFARRDVPGIVGLGKLRNGEPVVCQADG